MKFFILLLINFSFFYQVHTQKSRATPGCALVKKRIYCFGGTIALPVEDNPKTDYNLQATNDHIYMDLNPLDTLSTTANPRISIPLEWKHATNIYNGQVLQPRTYLGSAALDDEDSYVLYGGWQGQSGANVTHFRNLNYPFLKYDTLSDSWSSLPLSSDYIYTTASYFVNLGDRLWIWGGQRNSTTYTAPNILRQYNYKSKLWTINEVSRDWWMRIDHTATLALDGNIYIIGGAFQTDQPNSFTMAPLDKIIVYHTQTSQWSFVNTTGTLPTPRVAHTTNLIPNTNYLLIYGGRTLKDDSFTNCDDICYLYDVTKNEYSACNLPDVKHRYGHFATIYNKKYLLFIFGFTTKNIGADSINILDVSDPLKLAWVPANLAIKDDSVYPLPVPIVIVISVVIIILGLVLVGIMIYFFKFYLKRKNIDCEKYIDKNDTISDNDITLNEQKSTTLIKS